MDHFHHRDRQLWCEDVPLAALADDVGTPAFVYSVRTIRDHVRRTREAFAALAPLICFAVKANPNTAVLRLLREEGCGFDIVSVGELRRVLGLGADPLKIVFSGVGKTAAEMEEALRAGVLLFNVESEEELAQLEAVAERAERVAAVAVRVNPDVDPQTHRYITTGKRENKFGLDLVHGEALARRALASPHLSLRGVQCHIGSQITSVEPYRAAIQRTADFALKLRRETPDLTWLNMGGGYGIHYREGEAPALTEYAAAVDPVVRASGLELIMEPGRVIVGNAGALLTRVLFNKRSGGKRFVIVDAGMNDLIRPSLYEGYHRIWPVHASAPPGAGGDEPCDVVGPICESGDFLARERPLPEVARGEVLAVMSVGAYGFAMASNYNLRRRPPEVLVDGDRYAVVRARETFEDIDRLEHPDAPFRRIADGEVKGEHV